MNVEKRQEIERKVVRHLIRKMKKAGWNLLWVHDGEEKVAVSTETEAIDNVFGVDESTICFKKNAGVDGVKRSAYIVLGNDGYDCIADHSCSNHALAYDDFEEIMNEVQEYADKFCE